MKNIVIWNSAQLYGERSNVGDRAILHSIIQDLKDLGGSDIRINVLSNTPDYTRENFGVDAFPLHISTVLRAIIKADLVIIGGGDIVHDRSNLLWIPFNLYPALLAKVLRKKVMCYGIGVSDLDDITMLGRLQTRVILNKLDIITVRDSQSKSVLVELGVTKPIEVTADPAYRLSLEPTVLGLEELENVDSMIVACLWDNLCRGNSFFRSLPKNIKDNWGFLLSRNSPKGNHVVDRLASVLDEIVERYGATIVFVPMLLESSYSRSDLVFSQEIIARMRHGDATRLVNKSYSVNEVLSLFGSANMVISSRLHPLILSAIVGTPSIALTATPKIERAMTTLGQGSIVHNHNELDVDKICCSIDMINSQHNGIQEEIADRVNELKERALENAKLAIGLINKK